MKIVLWGTYDIGKPRIRILRDGLYALGVDLTEIHKDIWGDVSDKSALRGTGKWLHRGLRLLLAYPGLVWRYMHAPPHDLVLVSYPGQLDILVLRLFAWTRRTPIAFDWFISAFDTVVVDRKLLGPRNPLSWLLWIGEWLAAHAANIAFMDTAAHARRMEKLFRLVSNSIEHVWVGAEQVFFQQRANQPDSSNLRVLFYGQFIPLHGIETIVKAARLLRKAPIHWTLIGRGQEGPSIRALLAEDPLPALRWVEWVPYDDLGRWIADADVCLGIFGVSTKAASVIPNKVFQIVASGRPLVTRDSPAIRELLSERPPCVSFVNPGDAEELANVIQNHAGFRRASMPAHCHADLRNRIEPASIGRQFLGMLAKRLPHMASPHDHR